MVNLYDEKTGLVRKGIYKKIKYYILNSYLCPCAYIVLPKYTQQLKSKKLLGQLNLMVNGGLTYHDNHLNVRNKTGKIKSLVIDENVYGWDYGHCTDYIPRMPLLFSDAKKWTLDEIRQEIKRAINTFVGRI